MSIKYKGSCHRAFLTCFCLKRITLQIAGRHRTVLEYIYNMQSDTAFAIVGHSYRAPGVGGKGLWEFLAEAKSAWSPVPADRFDQDAFYFPEKRPGCFSSKGAHFLPDDIFAFDAPFFNMRPEEARDVDPQHRVILECALEAAESAGMRLEDLAGANIGVFSAVGSLEYGGQLAEDLPSTSTWAATGVAASMFANRLSYFFGLTGPSVSLDAACAGSSYVVHSACQSLRSGECDAAFVSAVALILGPPLWVFLDNLGYVLRLCLALKWRTQHVTTVRYLPMGNPSHTTRKPLDLAEAKAEVVSSSSASTTPSRMAIRYTQSFEILPPTMPADHKASQCQAEQPKRDYCAVFMGRLAWIHPRQLSWRSAHSCLTLTRSRLT